MSLLSFVCSLLLVVCYGLTVVCCLLVLCVVLCLWFNACRALFAFDCVVVVGCRVFLDECCVRVMLVLCLLVGVSVCMCCVLCFGLCVLSIVCVCSVVVSC